ncbi:unnamed protein product [Linum tenue]|uniref:INO80 complex subunit B-like conserved region domain-containing protein n=1 Tax=Linum tenue TaxID=586396 RepID=A0AAV0NM31_9ROSI|nr:unnamed protein product [Linum tenue]
MEGFGFSDASSAVRKKRSSTSRRPRPDSQLPSDYHDMSSLSSTPPSENNAMKAEDGGFVESDEASNNGSLTSFRGSNEQRHGVTDSRRCSEGVLAPVNWKNSSGNFEAASDGGGTNGNKVKKVKLKLGGVTRTINANSASDGASAVGPSSTKSSHFPGSEQKPAKDTVADHNRSITSDRGSGSRGVWKELPKSGSSGGKGDALRVKTPDENRPAPKQADNSYEPVRKSKRVPKRRLLDGMFDDGGEEDDEIRYLEKVSYGMEFEDEDEAGSRKKRRLSKVMKANVNVVHDADARGSSRSGKEAKKSKSGKVSGDTDYMDDDELASEGEPTTKKKRLRKELADIPVVETKKEITVTTRQRALQTGKDASTDVGAGLIEFPNGLPPAPPKKQKEKLSEVEQQLKRAEALQRRRMQVEKAAKESEAEAIRKILGQDSSRKKREEKVKKRQEEIAQERAANAMVLPSDRVRWVMGPSGTVVTFPEEVGLPSIFDPKPQSYPPAREKCAGPSCPNPYKYRDSKSKLPLCSLQCYKAIRA